MAGLLDVLTGGGTPEQSEQIMALAQGLLSARGSQGLANGIGLMGQAKQNAARNQLLQAQIAETQAQAQERAIKAQREQSALEQAARVRAELPSLFRGQVSPGAVTAPTDGVGPTMPPSEASGRSGFDLARAIQLGMDPKTINEYAALQNIGRQKVARTVETMVDGRPVTLQVDEYGQPVGQGLAQWKAPVFQSLGGTTAALDPISLKQIGDFAHTQTPDSIASNSRMAADAAANRGVQIRGQNMTDARAREQLQGAEQQFTPGAIDNAAARYNIDGTLPPMGMGKAGAMGRSAILNRAAELAAASGVSADDQRINQIGNKANTAALSKIQQQQTMVGAFERNFVKNADIALELSARVDRTGIPLANKWINAGKRAIAGDADLAAFDASVKAASNEYAKIVSGSMGNTALAEGEIKKIEGLLNAAQTPEQVASVLNLMKRETQNRMTAFEDEKKALRTTMRSKPDEAPAASVPAAPAAPPVPPKAKASDLKTGQSYTLPNGKVGVWDGMRFKVQ